MGLSAQGLKEQLLDQVAKMNTKARIKGQRVADTAKLNWATRMNPNTSELPAINQYANANNTDTVLLPSFKKNPDYGDYKVGIGERGVALAARHPIYTGAGVVGGIVADQLLGKPVEGLVDAVTLNALNLRPDERYGTTMTAMPQQPMPTPYNNPVFSSQPNDLPFAQGQIPPLSAEEITREIERQQKNMGVSAVTVNGLRQMQLAQQNNPYAQS